MRRLLLTFSMLAVVLALAGSAGGNASSSDWLILKEVGLRGTQTELSRHDIRPASWSLSPDLKQLAFVPYIPFDGRSKELWVADVRGPGERMLLHARGWLGEPAWAPDGRTIAVSQYSFGADGIWLVEPDGSNVRRVADYGSRLAWSPDSRQLAYVRYTNQRWLMGVLDVATGSTKELGEGMLPRWSPDGREVVYERILGCDCLPEIRVLTPSAGISRRLARGFAPSWSPDGRRIAYVRARQDERSSLWMISRVGRRPRRIVSNVSFSFPHSAWSRDGRTVAFLRDVRGPRCRMSLNVVAASGASRPRRLAVARSITLMAWRGKRVLYQARKCSG